MEPIEQHRHSGDNRIDPDARSAAPSSTDLSTLTVAIQPEMPLPGIAGLVVKDVSESNLADALKVFRSCFPSPDDQAAVNASYGRYIRGERRFHSNYHQCEIELALCRVFYIDDAPAGIGGMYRLADTPDFAYMGWFGVVPEHRHSSSTNRSRPLSLIITEYVEAVAREAFNATYLAAFTEDSPDNAKVHRFYERLGFEVQGYFDAENGERERIYVRKIAR